MQEATLCWRKHRQLVEKIEVEAYQYHWEGVTSNVRELQERRLLLCQQQGTGGPGQARLDWARTVCKSLPGTLSASI